MLRSLYSGVSGLRNHQVRMDVIGNNIANVNTVGFKASRVVFQDIYSQTLKPASGSTATSGGSNPQQIGLGVSLATVDVLQTRTGSQYTGEPLDLSIEGDGFFVVKDGSGTYYTRAGNFKTDENGTLVNANGLKVQGTTYTYTPAVDPVSGDPILDPVTGEQVINVTSTPNSNITIDSSAYHDVTVDKNGNVIGIDTTGNKVTLATIQIATFNNQGALEKVGQSLYSPTNNSGAPNVMLPGSAGAATLNPGALEMSNVDLAKEFTDMITTQRGFQANSRIITTSDSLLEELVNLKRQ